MALQRNPKTGLLEIVRNTPNAPAQLPQAEQPPPQTGGGLLSKIGKGAAGIAADIVQALPKAAATPFAAVSESLPALVGGRRETSNAFSRWALGQSDPNSRERAGAYAMGALNAGMFGFPAASAVVTTGARLAAREAAVLAAKTAAEKRIAAEGAGRLLQYNAGRLGAKVVKNLPADVGLGAGFGIASGVEQGHDAGQIAKDALGGAVLGVAAPLALGGAFKGTTALAGMAGKGAGNFLDKRIASLNSRLDGAKAMSKEGKSYYAPVAATAEKQIGKLEKQLKAAQALREFPTTLSQGLWRSNAHLVAPGKAIGEDLAGYARSQDAIAKQLPDVIAEDYARIKREALDPDMLYEYAGLMDEMDRLRSGKLVSEGRTAIDNATDLAALSAKAGENRNRLLDDYAKFRKWHEDALAFQVEKGTISQETANAFKAQHPNYTTHMAADFVENPSNYAKGGPTGSTSGFKAAKGSTRELQDLDASNIERMKSQVVNAVRSETKRVIADKLEKGKARLGTLWSSEDEIARREALRALGEMSAARKSAEKSKKSAYVALRNARNKGKVLAGRAGEVARGRGVLGTMGRQITARAEQLGQAGLQRGASVLEDAAAVRAKAYAPENFPGGRPNERARKMFAKSDAVVEQARMIMDDASRISGELVSVAKKPMDALVAATKRLSEIEARLAETNLSAAGRKEAIGEYRGVIETLRQASREIRDMMPSMADQNIKEVDLAKEGLGTWIYMRDGIREVRTAPKALADAMKGLSNPGAKAVGDFLDKTFVGRAITLPSRAVRWLATEVNPSFALIGNPLRDPQSIYANSGVGPQKIVREVVEGLISMVMPRSNVAKQREAVMRDMRTRGAPLQGLYERSKQGVKEMLDEARQGLDPRKRVVLRPDRLISEAGRFFEESARIAVWKAKLAETGSFDLAAKFAREASADFGEGGDWAKVINKVVPFFNATIQGSKSTVEAIAKRPYETARALVQSTVLPTVMLYSHNAKYASYRDIPQWERDKFWIIMLSEQRGVDMSGNPKMIPNYLKVPKGQAQQVLGSVMERTLDTGAVEDPESTFKFVASIAGDLSPVTASNWFPPIFQIPAELIANYSFFRGKQIEPDWVLAKDGEWYRSSELDPELRTAYDTSEIAKRIGKTFGWSAAKVDYVIKTGALNDFIRAFDLSKEATLVEERKQTTFEKLTQKPILRSVIGSSSYGQDVIAKEKATKEKMAENTTKINDPFVLRARGYRDGSLDPLRTLQFKESLRDPAVMREYRQFLSDERLGITSTERSLLGKGVADGERAGIIFKNMRLMSEAEASDYVTRLRRQKVITPDVMRQLRKLEAGE